MLRQKQFIEKATALLDSAGKKDCDFLFYVDVVNFKRVNEQCGLEKADQLLAAIGDFLNGLKPVVLWERMFSDRFLILVHLEKPTKPQRMVQVSHELIRSFLEEQQKLYDNCMLQLACGFSVIENEQLVRAMDEAGIARMEAKRRGAFIPLMFTQELLEYEEGKFKSSADVVDAWREERVFFYLQPKVNLKTGAITGAEALARMYRTDGTLIPPSEFLPVLEENGSVIELDKILLKKVCSFLSERIRQNLPVVPVSLNLSRLHIYDLMTPQELHDVTSSYKVPSKLIEFELTETVMLRDLEATRSFIDALRRYGHKVSIDDFGAGYTGLTILQELNVDTIKLDRSFLNFEEPYKSRNLAIVPNLINAAVRLNTSIICEGVETEEHCSYLLGLGCDAAQGYYFAKPMSVEEFCALFEDKTGRVSDQGEYRYPLPYMSEIPVEPEIESAPVPESKPLSKLKEYLKAKTVLITLASIGALLFLFHSTMGYEEFEIRKMFIESVTDNIDRFTETRVMETTSVVEDLQFAAGAFANLIYERKTLEFVDEYMQALNTSEIHDDIIYEFITSDEMQTILLDENLQAFSRRNYMDLMRGKNVVTGVRYNESNGDYWFGVGVPVYIGRTFVGAIRTVVDARYLVETGQFQSPFGEIGGIMIVNEDGKIAYSSVHTHAIGSNVYEHIIEEYGLAESVEQIQNGFAEEGASAQRLISSNGQSIYISQQEAGVNGWKYVVAFHSNNAHNFSTETQQLVHRVTLVLMGAVCLAGLAIFLAFRQVQKRASAEQKRYLLLSQFSDTILFDYSSERDEILFTDNARQFFGMTDRESLRQKGFMAGMGENSFIYPGDQFVFRQMLSGMTVRDRYECRVRLRSSAGRYVWHLVQFRFVYRARKLVSVVGKLINIDELYQREQRFRDMAMIDGATGLQNKSTSVTSITEMLTEDRSGALVVVDLDDLKRINDGKGHAAGDVAIRAIADSLKSIFRSTDVIGRIGGDEFIVYTRNLHSKPTLEEKLNSLMELIRSRDEKLSVSIGVARFTGSANYDELFNRADKALYEAKKKGKNNCVFSREDEETCA